MAKLALTFYSVLRMPIADILQCARAAEEAGFGFISVAESSYRDGAAVAAAIACNTSTIRLGTSVFPIYTRTPFQLAMAMATLDELSSGRMGYLGLGLGYSNRTEDHFGIKIERPLERMREYVEIMRMILAGEPLKYQGKVFRLERGFRLRFAPVRSSIPVFIASLTPKSVAQTAAIADGWMPVMIPLPRLAAEVTAFRQHVRDAGREPQSVIVRSPGAVTVTRDIDKAREESKAHLAFYITNMGDFYREQLIRLGYDDAVSKVRQAWDEGGRAAGTAAVPEALVDSLFFAGPVEACIERLEVQAAAGIDMHTVRVEAGDSKEMVRILQRLVG